MLGLIKFSVEGHSEIPQNFLRKFAFYQLIIINVFFSKIHKILSCKHLKNVFNGVLKKKKNFFIYYPKILRERLS